MMLVQERGRAPKVHLSETVLTLHKYNRKHQLKVLTALISDIGSNNNNSNSSNKQTLV